MPPALVFGFKIRFFCLIWRLFYTCCFQTEVWNVLPGLLLGFQSSLNIIALEDHHLLVHIGRAYCAFHCVQLYL
jgi:hypothetical protein